jgi:hypothetical protein
VSGTSGRGIEELREYLWEFVETARGPHHEGPSARLDDEWTGDSAEAEAGEAESDG